MDDRMILSMVKKNPATSSHVKNTLQEVDVSLSKSTIKRRLHQPDHFWKSILWTAEIKINLYKYDGKKKVCRRPRTAHDPKHTTSSVKHGEQCVPAALGYWCL